MVASHDEGARHLGLKSLARILDEADCKMQAAGDDQAARK
jgi:hypothetical protein